MTTVMNWLYRSVEGEQILSVLSIIAECNLINTVDSRVWERWCEKMYNIHVKKSNHV